MAKPRASPVDTRRMAAAGEMGDVSITDAAARADMEDLRVHEDNEPRDTEMIAEMIDMFAYTMVRQMTPLEIGQMLYPTAVAVRLKHVPTEIVMDHRSRYSKAELKRGQFFKIDEKYTFIMDHVAYDKRHK